MSSVTGSLMSSCVLSGAVHVLMRALPSHSISTSARVRCHEPVSQRTVNVLARSTDDFGGNARLFWKFHAGAFPPFGSIACRGCCRQ